jgi:hypothetical protein
LVVVVVDIVIVAAIRVGVMVGRGASRVGATRSGIRTSSSSLRVCSAATRHVVHYRCYRQIKSNSNSSLLFLDVFSQTLYVGRANTALGNSALLYVLNVLNIQYIGGEMEPTT